MKLLFFIHSLSAGGAERITAALANYWAGKGCDVVIVTTAGRERDFHTLHAGVRRISLDLERKSRTPLAAVWNNFRRMTKLRRVLIAERPDAAVAMMAVANSLLAWACRGTGIPAVGSERVHPPRVPLGRIWHVVRRRAYGRLAAVVAQTRASANWLAANTAADSERIRVIPNPVVWPLPVNEPARPPAAVKDAIGCRRLVLGSGRLVGQKGFDRLLDAFAAIADRHPAWGLVILGEGSERHALESRARALGIEERVRFPGTVGNVSDWYAAADVYALTSRFEGFPNTLLEAMAHGVPAVATECETGPADIVRHDVDGLLVPEGDQAALADSLARLMDDEQLRSRLGGRAIEVRERFSLENVATEWEKVFEEVSSEKGPGPGARGPGK